MIEERLNSLGVSFPTDSLLLLGLLFQLL